MPYRPPSLLLFASVATLLTPLAFRGVRILHPPHAPHAVQDEQCQPAGCCEGPYTEEELDDARGRRAGTDPADEFLKGIPRDELESADEATRVLERARTEAWRDRFLLQYAAQRRRTG